MKLKALAIVYQDVVKRRYIDLFSDQKHLTDEDLQKFCNKLLTENHPDRYQNASPEIINRQAIRFQVLHDLLKALKDPHSKDSGQAKINELKEWFLSQAQVNESLKFAACFVQKKDIDEF